MNTSNDNILEKTIIIEENNTPSISVNILEKDDKLIPGILFDRTNEEENNDINNGNNNSNIEKNNIINRKKKFIPINLVKAVDTNKIDYDFKDDYLNNDGETNQYIKNESPSESLLEQEQMSKYDKFKFKVNNEKNVNLSKIGLGKVTIIEAVAFFTNLLIYPAIFFQVWQTYMTQEAEDIDVYFNTLQLFGGTPEGAVGVIIGYLIKSTQMIAIGSLAVVFRIFLTFYICFGKKGLIYDLFTKK